VDNKTDKETKAAVQGYTQKLGFNLATNAHRSSGSTIKPFTLAEALIQGQTLETSRSVSNCQSLPNPGGTPDPYTFCNSDKAESGTFSLRRALAQSVNTVYLPLAKEIGRGKVASLAIAAGLDGPGTIKPGNLSFGIGAGVEVTPLSEAVAYGTLANGGVHLTPRTFTEIRSGASGTDVGRVIEEAAPSAARHVMSPKVAEDVVKALTDVVTDGTGGAAAQPFPVFGKTGTTNDSTDAWFTGCIPDQHICVASWMGYEYTQCRSSSSHVVGASCGGMHDLGGVKGQIFGGTLPAQVFARAQVDLRAIKAARAARAAGGLPVVTASPTPAATSAPTRRPRSTPRPTPTVAAVPTRTRAPTVAPTVAPPTQQPTRPPILPPPSPPSPTPSPTP
jgi:membrane peptidoglycan carboxypeptidase